MGDAVDIRGHLSIEEQLRLNHFLHLSWSEVLICYCFNSAAETPVARLAPWSDHLFGKLSAAGRSKKIGLM